jgi:hypothetical protein
MRKRLTLVFSILRDADLKFPGCGSSPWGKSPIGVNRKAREMPFREEKR